MRFALPQADARPGPASDNSPTSGAVKLTQLRGPTLSALIHGALVTLLLLTVFPNNAHVTRPEEIPVEIVRPTDLKPKPETKKPEAKKPPEPKPRPDPVVKVPPIDLTRPVPPPEKLEPPREPQQAARPTTKQSGSSASAGKTTVPPKTRVTPEEKTARLKPDIHGIKVPPETASKAPAGSGEPLVGHWVLDPLQIDLGHACGSQRLSGTIRIVRRDGERYYAQLRTTIHWSLCQPQGVLRRIMLRIHDGHVTMYDGGGVLDRGTIKDGVMVLRDAYGASVWRKIGK